MMSSDMLILEGVEKSFPQTASVKEFVRSFGRVPRRRVLRAIDLRIGRGELFGLLGPNGAGKTSLLKLMATLSIPDRGRIILDGVDVVRRPLEAKRRIAFCPAEERSFYYRLSGRANLAFFGSLVGLRGRELHRRIDEVAELVNLSEALGRPYRTYSSGMRQRLTVARAMLGDPQVLFLDEPTRAVDPIHADALRRLIRDELVGRRHKTVVLATNLLDEAWQLCDRIAVINGGEVVAIGPPASLTDMHRRLRYNVVLENVGSDVVRRAEQIVGSGAVDVDLVVDGSISMNIEFDPTADTLTELLVAMLHDGARVRSLRSLEPEPMDVFKQVTQYGVER